jgi:hypothetical protein
MFCHNFPEVVEKVQFWCNMYHRRNAFQGVPNPEDLHMSRPVTFAQRIKRMKTALKNNKIEIFLQELMLVGLDANALEDYKMSPRNLFEMAELLTKIKKLEGNGVLKDDDNWLKVIEGGKE